MQDDGSELFYLGVGPLAAILLGLALVPARGFTTASNFTFLFLAMVIVVAELGGRLAAVLTSVASALSLDFFLTEPYQRLAIREKHDVLAVAGLTLCGLVAAALGTRRVERQAALDEAGPQAMALEAAIEQLDRSAPLDQRLAAVLEVCRRAFPVAALAVSDGRGLVATVGRRGLQPPCSVAELDTLMPRGVTPRDFESRPAFPADGSRVVLESEGRAVGALDLWGNGAPASPRARRALSDVARLLARMLAGDRGQEPAR